MFAAASVQATMLARRAVVASTRGRRSPQVDQDWGSTSPCSVSPASARPSRRSIRARRSSTAAWVRAPSWESAGASNQRASVRRGTRRAVQMRSNKHPRPNTSRSAATMIARYEVVVAVLPVPGHVLQASEARGIVGLRAAGTVANVVARARGRRTSTTNTIAGTSNHAAAARGAHAANTSARRQRTPASRAFASVAPAPRPRRHARAARHASPVLRARRRHRPPPQEDSSAAPSSAASSRIIDPPVRLSRGGNRRRGSRRIPGQS